MATPALGLPDLDSGVFVYQPFPMHQRLTPAVQAAPLRLHVEISSSRLCISKSQLRYAAGKPSTYSPEFPLLSIRPSALLMPQHTGAWRELLPAQSLPGGQEEAGACFTSAGSRRVPESEDQTQSLSNVGFCLTALRISQ